MSGTKKHPGGCYKPVVIGFFVLVFLGIVMAMIGGNINQSHVTRTDSSRAVAPKPTAPPDNEDYPGPWRTDDPIFDRIAVTLGRNGIGGCGEFHFRLAKGRPDPGEALVYCTGDGRNWTHYLVFYKTEKVMRIKAEPGVPYPKTLVSLD